ncbi:MAG: hypothetical protein J6Y77_00690 [Paludibacteraceae bacterium]|nr:hypothetical protein [Paludibacteraceae bacterium]
MSQWFTSPDFKEVRETKVRDVLNGNIFVKNFATRQLGLLVLLVFLSFLFIENRMNCEQKLARIDELSKELEYEIQVALQVEAELNASSKKSELEKTLEKYDIPLHDLTERPSYIRMK